MKKFTVALLGVIFVALIACSVQSISADHLEPGIGIFKDDGDVELRDTKGVKGMTGSIPKYDSSGNVIEMSNYLVFLQTVYRNGDGQLISAVESTANAGYIPHKITDDVFDTLMGKKEIVTIDNIKYEKVQYTHTPTLEETRWGDTQGRQIIFMCEIFEGHGYQCIPIFQILVSTMTLEPQGVPSYVTHQWTILRDLN